MLTSVSLDASVLLAAVSPSEPSHEDAKDFLTQLHQRQLTVQVPAQFMLEIFAAFRRSPRDTNQLGFMTKANPMQLKLLCLGEAEVTDLIAWLSQAFPQRVPTRGGDLAYLWVAWKFHIPLVSLDGGMLRYSGPDAEVISPAQGLSRIADAG